MKFLDKTIKDDSFVTDIFIKSSYVFHINNNYQAFHNNTIIDSKINN